MKRQPLLPILAVPVDRADRDPTANYNLSESIQAAKKCRTSADCGYGFRCDYDVWGSSGEGTCRRRRIAEYSPWG